MPREQRSRSPSGEHTRNSSSRYQDDTNRDAPLTHSTAANESSSSSSSHLPLLPETTTSVRSRSRSRERSRKDSRKEDKHRHRDKHRNERRDHSRRHRSRSYSVSSRSSSSSFSSSSGSRKSPKQHRTFSPSSSVSSSHRHHRGHHHHRSSGKRHKHDHKEKKEKKSKRDHHRRSRSPDDLRRHPSSSSQYRTTEDSSSTNIKNLLPITSTVLAGSSIPMDRTVPLPSTTSSAAIVQNSENRILGMFGYTAENNPYGDPNLNAPFLWGKKVQKDLTTGKTSSVPTTEELLVKRDAMMDEIERARERRSKREAEREEMERLRAEEARLKDANQYAGWEEKEEEFHRAQVRTRILIRIKEQRERISDSLVKNPMVMTAIMDGNAIDEPFLLTEIQLRPPLRTIQNCYYITDLETIINDIKDVQEYEGPNGLHALYWSVILDVVQDEIRRRKVREIGLKAGRTLASLQAVEEDIDTMFEGQNKESLDDMEKQVRNTLSSSGTLPSHASRITDHGMVGGGAIDVEYWEGVLKNLQIARAKAILQRLHEELIMKRLTQMENIYAQQQGLAVIPRLDTLIIPRDTAGRRSFISKKLDLLRHAGMISTLSYYEGETAPTGDSASSSSTAKDTLATDGEDASFVDETGRILPTGNVESAMGEDLEVVLPVAASSSSSSSSSTSAPVHHKRHTDYDPLLEKFRPRKPRYFNRIKTGYDWNRYNQAHYDRDNPPPKTVQGYKFNIFFPDLLDRTKTPSFHLEPADTDDYVLIRFHGGPPYEDIAFKIVNREWDRGKKSGFRSTFDRGILQLYFNFRRYRYRK